MGIENCKFEKKDELKKQQSKNESQEEMIIMPDGRRLSSKVEDMFMVDGIIYHEGYYDNKVDDNRNIEYANYIPVDKKYIEGKVDLNNIEELNDEIPLRAEYAGVVYEFDNYGQYKLAELEFKLKGK